LVSREGQRRSSDDSCDRRCRTDSAAVTVVGSADLDENDDADGALPKAFNVLEVAKRRQNVMDGLGDGPRDNSAVDHDDATKVLLLRAPAAVQVPNAEETGRIFARITSSTSGSRPTDRLTGSGVTGGGMEDEEEEIGLMDHVCRPW
jgi:hypothetical protein